MKNQGKFLAKVTVFGGAMDSKGNIISRDKNGLPSIWLTPLAGEIPNRNVLTGSVAQRSGIKLDSNGVIGRGTTTGDSFAFRLLFGQYTKVGEDERYGDQYTFNILQDLTDSPNVASEIVQLEQMLGEPSIFTVARPELPEDYEKKTNQHVSPRKTDPQFHPTLTNDRSIPATKIVNDLGNFRSDEKGNPELTVVGTQSTENIQHNPVK